MNALDTIRMIHNATERVAQWPDRTRGPVLRARPPVVREKGYTPLEWLTAVEVFRQADETAESAAERLGLYLTLHQERWNQTPTLARVQQQALEDRERTLGAPAHAGR